MDIFLIILAILCLITGFIGCVAPVLPGPLLAFVSLLLFKLTIYGDQISWTWICVFGALVILSTILDYLGHDNGVPKIKILQQTNMTRASPQKDETKRR